MSPISNINFNVKHFTGIAPWIYSLEIILWWRNNILVVKVKSVNVLPYLTLPSKNAKPSFEYV